MGKRNSRVESLYPPFGEIILKFNERLKQEGIKAYPFETYRSFERQEELYAKGRTYNEQTKKWVLIDRTKIVTKARPGFSWHAYGVATDYVFDGNPHKSGIQWTWEDADLTTPEKDPLPWAELGRIGIECGLEWAGNWTRFKEFPHFQLTYGFRTHQVYDILMSDGLKAVWEEFDKKQERPTIVMPEIVIHGDTTPDDQQKTHIMEPGTIKHSNVLKPKVEGSIFSKIINIIIKLFKGGRK